jgi:hypothetical protein
VTTRRTVLLACIVIAITVARPVAAQHLVEVESTPLSLSIDEPVNAFEENGALVAYGRAIGRGPVALRIDATTFREEPGFPPATTSGVGIARAVSCGGRRWLLEYDASRTRFSVRPSDGTEVWGRVFTLGAFPTMSLQCAGTRPIVGWVELGEFVTVALMPTVEHRTRVWPQREQGEFEWIARSADEIFASVRLGGVGEYASVLHIVLGGIAHRQSLGAAMPGAVDIANGILLVSTSPPGAGPVTLRSFALDDLAPIAAAAVPVSSEPRANGRCIHFWALAPGVVVAAIEERWEGPDTIAIPGSAVGGRPPRHEPVVHRASGLYAWSPRSTTVGPRFELGARNVGAGIVIASRLVLVEPVEAAGILRGVVQLRAARLRRFAIAP